MKRGQADEAALAFLSSTIRPELNDEMAALEAKGLCTGHAYSVLDAVELPTGDKLIQLRNPWGTFEWNGDWNDADPRWTPELRACTACADGGTAEDDGSFFMSVADFQTYFRKVGVCDPFALATGDEDGDGVADTSLVAGIRLANGAVAKVECGAATDVVLTAYQQDVRSEADGTAWKMASVGVKCAATGGQWMDVMKFPMRAYSRSIPVQPDETEFEVKIVLEGEGVCEKDASVWLSATTAGAPVVLSGPAPPAPPVPATVEAPAAVVEEEDDDEESASVTVTVDLGLMGAEAVAPVAAVHSAPPPPPPTLAAEEAAVAPEAVHSVQARANRKKMQAKKEPAPPPGPPPGPPGPPGPPATLMAAGAAAAAPVAVHSAPPPPPPPAAMMAAEPAAAAPAAVHSAPPPPPPPATMMAAEPAAAAPAAVHSAPPPPPPPPSPPATMMAAEAVAPAPAAVHSAPPPPPSSAVSPATVDTSGDGHADTILVDTTGDGKADTAVRMAAPDADVATAANVHAIGQVAMATVTAGLGLALVADCLNAR